MTRYALAAAVIAILALGGGLVLQHQRANRAADALSRAERQLTVARAELAQARLAREVEAARARKAAADAEKANATLDQIMAAEGDADAPLDPAIRNALRGLQSRDELGGRPPAGATADP